MNRTLLIVFSLAAPLLLVCGCDSPTQSPAVQDYRGDQTQLQADPEAANTPASPSTNAPPSQSKGNGRTLLLLGIDCSKSTEGMRPQLLSAVHDFVENIDEATTDLESYRFASTIQQFRTGVTDDDDYDAALAKSALGSDLDLGTNYPKALDYLAHRAAETTDGNVTVTICGDALNDFQDSSSLNLYRSAAESLNKNPKVSCVRYYGAVPGTWESLRSLFRGGNKLDIRALDQPIGN